jgi:catechol 2,3-dioxygenase-like lactoylglutathione lyase family enzyme
MPVVGFDHVVLPTSDSEQFIAFYKGLGFNIIDEEQWRTGETNRFAIQVGNSKINVHPLELTGVMWGATATPGCGDLCFVWEGTVDQILQMISNLGAEVVDGPVRRRGGRNAGQTWATSVYVWDPDGNILEFMVYD